MYCKISNNNKCNLFHTLNSQNLLSGSFNKDIYTCDLHDGSALLDEAELHKRNFQKIVPASKMESIAENYYDNTGITFT